MRATRRRLHRQRAAIRRAVAEHNLFRVATRKPIVVLGRTFPVRLANRPENGVSYTILPWGPTDRVVTAADGRRIRVGQPSGRLIAHTS